MNFPEDIIARLSSLYTGEKIADVETLTDGWETEILGYQLVESGRRHVVRIFNADGIEKASQEFAALQKLHALGYPVPMVHHFDEAPPPFFTMDRIAGTTLGDVMLAADPERAHELGTRFCQVMVDLHALKWEDYFDYPFQSHDPFAFIDNKIIEYQTAIDRFNMTDEFRPLMDWVRANRVPCMKLSIAHNDLHPWNVLLTPDDRLFVIDWTNIEIADPRYDLAWTLLLSTAYLNQAISDQFLAGYRRLSGNFVRHMEYFRVLAVLRRLGSIVISIMVGPEQMGMNPAALERMHDTHHLRFLHDLLVQDTGVRLPSVERLLD